MIRENESGCMATFLALTLTSSKLGQCSCFFFPFIFLFILVPAFQGMISAVAFLNSPRMKTKLSFVYKDYVQHKKFLIACCLLCVASVKGPLTDVLLSACSPSACHSLMRPLK